MYSNGHFVNLLQITQEQWLAAESYFTAHPDAIKMPKPHKYKLTGSRTGNSFVKIDGEIYAIGNGEYLGEGSFAKVKIAQTQNGENYAFRIEGIRHDLTASEVRARNFNKENETTVTSFLGYSKGGAIRSLAIPKIFKNHTIIAKEYTVNVHFEGIELLEALRRIPFTPQELLIIFTNCCLEIQKLHEQGIIHCDIKYDNFMFNKNEDMFNIKPIDYGFSKKLASDQRFVKGFSASGGRSSMAPEIINSYEYSFSSDVYALGVMFKKCFFETDLSSLMTTPNPDERLSLPEVIEFLTNRLKEIPESERLPNASYIIAENATQSHFGPTSSSKRTSRPDSIELQAPKSKRIR